MPGESDPGGGNAPRGRAVPPPDALRELRPPFEVGAAALPPPRRAPRGWRSGPARAVLLLGIVLVAGRPCPGSDSGVIRLAPPTPDAGAEEGAPARLGEGRRGFDYEGFEARLESLWFQRKALLAEGRDADAAKQAELIRAFCAEEGIRRVDGLAAALLSEARRYLEEGNYRKARASLDLAETFDPGRPQVRAARAVLLWRSGEGRLAAAGEYAAAAILNVREAWRGLSLVNDLLLALNFALVATVGVVGLLMVVRHHVPLRHDVEEAVVRRGGETWAPAAGWAVLALPLLTWLAAGWAALYWLAATFRYMRRGEKAAAAVLLTGAALAVPAFRITVALYGITADPVVRTSLASASGTYDPDRIVKMRGLVDAHPDEAIYRFLLAGLYKNGRYFEEAYDEYKQVLSLEPSTYQALINVGNIFHQTGQHGEAAAYYRRAIAARPDSVLAWFNLHLSQSEAFDFKEAETSLNRARGINAPMVADLFSRNQRSGERPSVVDAAVGTGAILRTILRGSEHGGWLETEPGGPGPGREIARQFLNPLTFGSILALLACSMAALALARSPRARRCVRCGRPFCQRCRSSRDPHEYCSQCTHLFVIGDGLAPETKTRKLYEIESYERRARLGRRLVSLVLPGAGHVLGGRPGQGTVVLAAWLAAVGAAAPGVLAAIFRVAGIDARLDLLRVGSVPAAYGPDAVALVAIPVAILAWLAGNLRLPARREA